MHYQQWGMKEIPSDMSCTELQQRWGKPRGKKIRPDSVIALSCAKVKPYKKQTSKLMAATVTNQRIQPVTPQNIQRLTESLPGTPVAYLLNPDLPMDQTKLGQVQTNCLLPYHLDKYKDRRPGTALQPCGNTAFPLHTDGEATPVVPSQYIACISVLPLTINQARTLERKTVRQADTHLWYQSRKNRITASAFHRVVKRVEDFNDKFTQSVLSAPRSVSSVPCSYGTAHVSIAKSKYCELKPSVHLHDCGLCVSPSCSFLGATPDAKVCCGGVTGILEVKCPYAARDMTVEEAVHAQMKFCLCRVDGKFQLDREHDYYCQVQGQLMITGAPFCDFVVYTKYDMHIERIFPDQRFQNVMMEKLASFYCKYALPLLQSNQRNSDTVPKPPSPIPQGE